MTGHPLAFRMIAAAAIGGALGALARWELGRHFPYDGGFPWTTFWINVSGSLLLAALPAVAYIRHHPWLPIFLGPGVLGGFTTLSAYAEESRALLTDGDELLGFTYLALTLAVCVVAVRIAHHLSSPAAQQEFEDEEGNE